MLVMTLGLSDKLLTRRGCLVARFRSFQGAVVVVRLLAQHELNLFVHAHHNLFYVELVVCPEDLQHLNGDLGELVHVLVVDVVAVVVGARVKQALGDLLQNQEGELIVLAEAGQSARLLLVAQLLHYQLAKKNIRQALLRVDIAAIQYLVYEEQEVLMDIGERIPQLMRKLLQLRRPK